MKSLLLSLIFIFSFQLLHLQVSGQLSSFIVGSGNGVIEVVVPGQIPPIFRSAVAIPGNNAVLLDNCPAYTWSFGCANTAAAMAAGYYDNHGFPQVFTGISNEGVMPMDNTMWGTVVINGETRFQCPLSASMMGLDERTMPGHVDDFWVNYNHFGPDPYILNGWVRHEDEACTGDFMGSNQSLFANADGMTRFFFIPDGSPLHDYTGNEPLRRDGCHGLRLFYESRDCPVVENYTQLITGVYGNTLGFTFSQYCEEIDNGRPVIIQLAGHCVLGMGYDPEQQLVYLHDTWDYALHSMVWGEAYAGMDQWGVTVIRLFQDNGPPQSEFTASTIYACKGEFIQFSDLSDFSPEEWYWTFGSNGTLTSEEQNPVISFSEAGDYSVSLHCTNSYGFDTEQKDNFLHIVNSCYCSSTGDGSASFTEIRFSSITFHYEEGTVPGYNYIASTVALLYRNCTYPIMIRIANASSIQPACHVNFDWNADFDFLDVGEQLLVNYRGAGIYSAIVQVPVNAITGLSRLRMVVSTSGMVTPCGNNTGATIDFPMEIVSDESLISTTIRFFPECLFNPATLHLNQSLATEGSVFPTGIADLVTIEWVSSSQSYQVMHVFPNVALSVTGECELFFPESIDGVYFFILKHRNSLEICSSAAIYSGTGLIDFTSNPEMAMGNSMLQTGSFCLIPAGDINQDGCINEIDVDLVANAAAAFGQGYLSADVNADGLVDASDLIITDRHASPGICKQVPE